MQASPRFGSSYGLLFLTACGIQGGTVLLLLSDGWWPILRCNNSENEAVRSDEAEMLDKAIYM